MEESIQTLGGIDLSKFKDGNLRQFDPVNLERLTEADLMDRVDRKYLFPVNMISEVLSEMLEYYRILSIKDCRYSHVKSMYADTGDFNFYLQHHNGHLNRHKVRYRQYHNSGLQYLETKFKNNKGRTQKKRMRLTSNVLDPDVFNTTESNFLEKIIPMKANQLRSTLEVGFTRLHFLHKKNAERLTIDLDLQYRHKEQVLNFPEVVIAELKQSRIESNSEFACLMKNRNIRPTPFSKYCIGISLLHNVKKNRFKRILLNLSKISKKNVLSQRYS